MAQQTLELNLNFPKMFSFPPDKKTEYRLAGMRKYTPPIHKTNPHVVNISNCKN